MFKIIDNYLKKEDYTNLRQMLESYNFPWYFYSHTADKTDDIREKRCIRRKNRRENRERREKQRERRGS